MRCEEKLQKWENQGAKVLMVNSPAEIQLKLSQDTTAAMKQTVNSTVKVCEVLCLPVLCNRSSHITTTLMHDEQGNHYGWERQMQTDKSETDADRQITDGQTDGQTDRQTDRLTDRLTDRQTDRQTD